MQSPTPSLRARLFTAADAWCAATGRSLGGLSSLVTNHGSTLERLRDPGAAVTDVTLEKFARFFADPANWPEVTDRPTAELHEGSVEPGLEHQERCPVGPNASLHEGRIPAAALQFCHAVGVTASEPTVSPCKAEEITPAPAPPVSQQGVAA